jgi:hypothetical protein
MSVNTQIAVFAPERTNKQRRHTMNAVLKPGEKNQHEMWEGRDGRFTPPSLVKDYDKLKEQTVKPLIQRWLELSTEVADLKANIFDEVESLLSVCADDYGVTLAGKKGNVTLYLYDGSFFLQRRYQDRVQFDERLLAAEQLVRECLDEWAGEASDELRTLITAAFERNKEGDIRRSELVRLRKLKIDDERWQRAMGIIAEAEQIIESACYFQVQRRDNTGKYQPVPLDFAAVHPARKTTGVANSGEPS